MFPLKTHTYKFLPAYSAIFMGLILAGCGGGGGNGNIDNGTTSTEASTGTTGSTTGSTGNGETGGGVLSVSVMEANGLTATLAEDKNAASVGGTVTYTLTLSNKTAASVPVNYNASLPSQPSASLIVRDGSGNTVFQPVPGSPPLDTLALLPGQSLSKTLTVTAFAASGTYDATATFSDSAITNVGPLAITVQ